MPARKHNEKSLLTIFLQKDTFVSCILYAVIGMITVLYTEVFPLWLLLPTARGGLSSTPQDIGLIMMISAPSQLIGQLVGKIELYFLFVFVFAL